eukprot:CAMPEP_0194374288 /NCGR_PEP_ID=MMETSP0174-20130528/22692_1 /TAXON_ID=216777 /ORGANISM="Proboscia alata, Strain PI-D3" /LENGTH=193 /DNA_ID=CAMNT_0039153767 /DNA_START=78 /DNA_END=659 /DNA_ORIENTATION=+
MRNGAIVLLSACITELLSGSTEAYTVTTKTASNNNRRQFLGLIAGAATLPTAGVAHAAGKSDIPTLQQTAIELKACTTQIDLFISNLASESPIPNAPTPPLQIPFRVLQGLSSKAHSVHTHVPSVDFEADDFLGVAAEYAEHAGSLRDLVKLAKLGRIGENGSEEVAMVYAKKAAEELKETEKALSVLVMAVQ